MPQGQGAARFFLARRAASTAFCLDVVFHALALLGEAESARSSPVAVYVAYAPHPYAPLALFMINVGAQLVWLLKMYPAQFVDEDGELQEFGETDCTEDDREGTNIAGESPSLSFRVYDQTNEPEKGTSEECALMSSADPEAEDNMKTAGADSGKETISVMEPAQMRYLPHYILGSICQATWAMLWTTRHFDLCTAVLFVNLFSQMYALFGILRTSGGVRFPTANVTTHVVVKVRIALCVLGLWKAWGAVDIVPPPSPLDGFANCIFFISLAAAAGPDPTLGLLLALILFSLGMGQHHNQGWHLAFNWSAIALLLFVMLDWTAGVQVRRACMSDVVETG